MIIYSLTNKYRFSSGDHMFIVWSNIQTYKKQTNNENKQSLSCSDHQLIIWWSFFNHLEINKQTKHIIWWSSGYHYMIIAYLITNKQTNKQTNKAFHQVVICWSFDDNLLIIWWSSIDYMTNKQTNLIIWWSFLIINYMTTTKLIIC